ncbi:MAG: hypothetical protein HPZ86_00760 [Clostridia bacterium]|nr:hypothetical protein [Clostridia bacterium]
MEKKENNIAKNTSSGAEKVENIQDRAQAKAESAGGANAASTAKKNAVKKEAKKTDKRRKVEKTMEQKEKVNAKKRVDAALAREERKAKKAEMKAAQKAKKEEMKALRKAKQQEKRLQMKEKHQERIALMKEKRAERKAERLARKELLRSETAAQRIERIEKEHAEKLALKKQQREQAYNLKLERRDARLKKREQRLKDRQHRRETRRTPGFGGWLAAVISLGVVTLALTAVVTLGAIDIAEMNTAMTTTYRGTLYELVGIMENVDTDLNKVRVSASSAQQSRLLTDLLLQARLAESSLERFPLNAEADANVTSFINRTADYSQAMLNKIHSGQKLTQEDVARIEKLYQTNHKVREELNRLATTMSDKDMESFIKAKKGNRVFESFQTLENATLEENNEEQGPFADVAPQNKEGGEQTKKEEITSSRAEELCLGYFKDYAIDHADYAGETTAQDIEAYNFFLHDERGRQLFAQISKKGGELVSFDFYEDCSAKNFDLERSKMIAEDYLSALGYENMTAVWVNESGTQATFNFAYEQNGAVYYPDMVKVKVCETKGKVVGFDAVAFLKNHRTRAELNTQVSIGEAQEKLNPNLRVEASRLTVIPVDGKETAAYEFVCDYQGDTYFIYVDAMTGEEVRILNVLNSKQGRVLM